MRMLIHGATGKMGKAILSGVLPEWPTHEELDRVVVLECVNIDEMLAAFDAKLEATAREKVAGWPP